MSGNLMQPQHHVLNVAEIVPTPDELLREHAMVEIRPESTIPGAGKGVFAKIDIQPFTKICVYPGVVLSSRRLRNIMKKNEKNGQYDWSWQYPFFQIKLEQHAPGRPGGLEGTLSGRFYEKLDSSLGIDPSDGKGNILQRYRMFAALYINEPPPSKTSNIMVVRAYNRFPTPAIEYWSSKMIPKGSELFMCYGTPSSPYKTSCRNTQVLAYVTYGDDRHTPHEFDPLANENNALRAAGTPRVPRGVLSRAGFADAILLRTLNKNKSRPSKNTKSGINTKRKIAQQQNNNQRMRMQRNEIMAAMHAAAAASAVARRNATAPPAVASNATRRQRNTTNTNNANARNAAAIMLELQRHATTHAQRSVRRRADPRSR